METTTKREAIFTNPLEIKRQQDAVTNGLPGMQKVLDTYNEFLPDIPPLDTNSFRWIFNDPDGIEEGLKHEFYNSKFSENHRSFGITKDKGMKLIDDQYPDFGKIKRAIAEIQTAATSIRQNAPADAYEIDQNKVIISEYYFNSRIVDNYTQYLEFPNEFRVRDILQNIAKNFDDLRELVPLNVLNFDDYSTSVYKTDFNLLNDVFDVHHPRHGETKFPVMKPSAKFYMRLKQGLIQTGKQGF